MLSPSSKIRLGLSLVEVLSILGIISLLVVLLIPAIQAARESARSIQCLNNLKQLGVALNSHQLISGYYPTAMRPDGSAPKVGLFARDPFSAQTQLLSFLEHTSLYNSLNISHGNMIALPMTSYPSATSPENRSISSIKLSVFLCPSDVSNTLFNSYRTSTGPFPYPQDSSGVERGGGAFPGLVATASNDFLDGLSNTVGISERTGGSNSTYFDKKRDLWFSGINNVGLLISSSLMEEVCSSVGPKPSVFWTRPGATWIQGNLGNTMYNHVGLPNSSGSDCSAFFPEDLLSSIGGGMVSARSHHINLVNVLFMDGSARSVTQYVSPALWRSLSSRAASDLANGSF